MARMPVPAPIRPWLWVLAGAAFVLLVAYLTGRLGDAPGFQNGAPSQAATFRGAADVIDGDSLRVNGVEMRLVGVDAPEYRQTCEEAGQPVACGRRAREELAALVAGRALACRSEGHDRYGRVLARCMAGEIDVNREMVRRGQAVAYGDYHLAEAQARWAGRGLWAGRFVLPSEWRDSHPR